MGSNETMRDTHLFCGENHVLWHVLFRWKVQEPTYISQNAARIFTEIKHSPVFSQPEGHLLRYCTDGLIEKIGS